MLSTVPTFQDTTVLGETAPVVEPPKTVTVTCPHCSGARYVCATGRSGMGTTTQCFNCRGLGTIEEAVRPVYVPPPPKKLPPAPCSDPNDPTKLAIPETPPTLPWTLVPQDHGIYGTVDIRPTKQYLSGVWSKSKSFALPTADELAMWLAIEWYKRDNERLKAANAALLEQIALEHKGSKAA